jgi:hypothetical protein
MAPSPDRRADCGAATWLSRWCRAEELPSRRAVIVAVGPPDRRVVAATRCAALVPAADRRAVHVATTSADAQALGVWWMDAESDG